MIKRKKVGLGTFPLASSFNKITNRRAEEVVRTFLDNGGYYIDTAPLYGNGKVEKLLGRVLKDRKRDSYYLITKTVKTVDEKGKLKVSGKYDDVIKGLEHSLDRLGLDYVDQLMIHSPDNGSPISETLGAMEVLQKQGKVMDLAVSNVNLKELKTYNKTGKIKYVQNKFSLINRSINKSIEKYLLVNKIFLLPWHLLEIGLLTSSAFDGITLGKDDFRNTLSYWNKDNQNEIFAWVRDELAPVAKEVDCTIDQLNIAWGLAQKMIDFVVVGTTNPEYVKINLKANEIKLSKKKLEQMEHSYKKFEKLIRREYDKSVKEFRGLNDKYY